MAEKTPLNFEDLAEIEPTLTQIGKLRIYDYGNRVYLLTGFHQYNRDDTTPEAHDVARFISLLSSQGIGVELIETMHIWAQIEKYAILIKTKINLTIPTETV